MPKACHSAWIRRVAIVGVLGGSLLPGEVGGQQSIDAGTQVHWWHGLALLGGYAILTQVDDEIQGFVRDNRSATSDDLASFGRRAGQAEIYASIGLGVLGAGWISGDREVRDAGIRISSSLALTGLVVTVAKLTAGRTRPSSLGSRADDFSLFSGHTSAPSGHSAMAFALATALSDEIRNPWATAGLYAVATTTAWSRMNDDAHWFSDVVVGAAVGVVSARFMNGKLTLFGIKPPRLRPAATGLSLAWTGDF